MSERSVRRVPLSVVLLLVTGVALQLCWHSLRPGPLADARALPPAPSLESLRIASLGDDVVTGKLLMLWLQAFDNQPGVSIPFRDLDYGRVQGWLQRILGLDPRGQYPLLAASRLYGSIPDEDKQRQMFDFVYEQFLRDPNRRWPWLAHAAIVARHRLADLPLALKYARALADHATGSSVPAWVRDMSVLVLEEMGEKQAARLRIRALLDSGVVTAPHERKYLLDKLEELDQ